MAAQIIGAPPDSVQTCPKKIVRRCP